MWRSCTRCMRMHSMSTLYWRIVRAATWRHSSRCFLATDLAFHSVHLYSKVLQLRWCKIAVLSTCSHTVFRLSQMNGPLTERQAARVMLECVKVIAACHKQGVVHGDVKPANFLFKERLRNPLRSLDAGLRPGWLKAVDFGCSQVLRGAQLHRRTGTPGTCIAFGQLPYHCMK